MSELAGYLKVGTLALVLALIEDDAIDRDLSLDSPVLAYRKVSRDLACQQTVRLKDGRDLTAIDLQWEFLTRARRYFERQPREPWVTDVLTRWESVLTRLQRDPLSLDRELDWVIKWELL